MGCGWWDMVFIYLGASCFLIVFLMMVLMMTALLLVLYLVFLMLLMSISPSMAMHLPLNLLSATGVAEEDDDDPVAVVEDAPVLDEVSLSLPGGQSGGPLLVLTLWWLASALWSRRGGRR